MSGIQRVGIEPVGFVVERVKVADDCPEAGGAPQLPAAPLRVRVLVRCPDISENRNFPKYFHLPYTSL